MPQGGTNWRFYVNDCALGGRIWWIHGGTPWGQSGSAWYIGGKPWEQGGRFCGRAPDSHTKALQRQAF